VESLTSGVIFETGIRNARLAGYPAVTPLKSAKFEINHAEMTKRRIPAARL
jgi:hypothetical protein